MSAIRRNKGFTLIEILIVVIILGILAAIVIPQFSNASTAAKTSAVTSTAQSLRSQIALYKLQHNDTLPGTSASTPSFWTLMTTQTDATGAAWTTASTSGPFGPYMQSIPANALNQLTTVVDVPGALYGTTANATVCGWAYDYTTGAGTGRIYGTGTDSKALVGP
jgi:general secretion pathway protein G